MPKPEFKVPELMHRFRDLALDIARTGNKGISLDQYENAVREQRLDELRILADEICRIYSPAITSGEAQKMPSRADVLEPIIDSLIADNPGLALDLNKLKGSAHLNLYLK